MNKSFDKISKEKATFLMKKSTKNVAFNLEASTKKRHVDSGYSHRVKTDFCFFFN